MANHNKVGNFGERLAQKYLTDQGYQILGCNWRWGRAEIDCIAQKNEVVIFVEVKTLTHAQFGLPEQQVTAKKQELLYQAATEYLYQIQHEGEFQFDILAIILEPEVQIRHFPDAFFPDWSI